MTTALETQIDYALMAGYAYRTTRDQNNWFPVPKDWTPFFPVPDDSTSALFPVGSTGFEAIAFKRGTDIVISFSGTDPNNSGPLSPDGQTNGALAAGNWSDQLLHAAEYYLTIKAANPNANITLTGHSLGGGLAALIAVFFDVHAQTFDQAPFANSALNMRNNNASALLDRLTALVSTGSPYADGVTKLTAFLQMRIGQPSDFIPRLSQVDTMRVDGEFLQGGLVGNHSFGNADSVLTHSPADWAINNYIATTGPAFDLHSQALLSALLQSQKSATDAGAADKTLGEVSKKLTGLLSIIFGDKLFASNSASRTEDFLNRIVRHEAGVQGSFAADAMVTRFTKDLWKLAQEGGLTMTEANVSKALIAFAIQMYYENTPNATSKDKTLFSDVTGGARFDMADVSAKFAAAFVANAPLILADAKGFDLYFKNYLQQGAFIPAERQLMQSVLPYMRDWCVQAGTHSLSVTDDLNRGAFMLGGTGNDQLTGGSHADLLVGNAGNDTLTGGLGNDTLLGGQGNDTYMYQTGDGLDTILDSDGQGSIVVNGSTLVGGAQYGDARVHRDANGHVYVDAGNNRLVVDGSIVIEGEQTGGLGLTMTAAVTLTIPVTTKDIFGDLKPKDFDLVTDGVQSQTDDLGNTVVDPSQADADRADILFDSDGNDHIVSGGGNDTVLANRGGDDFIETGAGRDWVQGGAGDDLIAGGADGDVLLGGTGNDRVYADGVTAIAAAIANGNSQAGTGQQGDWLSGGTGDDTLVGGNGNDVLSGGGGADLLCGGAGDDDIMGDADWTATSLDWSVTVRGKERYYSPSTGTPSSADGQADVIYAGAGRDHVWGDIGNDVIFGEDGGDELQGNGGNDAVFGGAGADFLYGEGQDSDTAGNDYLDGGADADVIFGNAGDDILVGGTGDDTLFGGTGQDTYVFNRGNGKDIIYDNKADNNVLRFGAGISASDVTLRLGSLLLDLGQGDAIHLNNSDANGVLTDFDKNDVFNSVAMGTFAFADGTTLSSAELLARGFDLDGTQGDDTISGTNTTDRISGLKGNDTLIGAAGSDVYIFNAGDGQDAIQDTGALAGDADSIQFGAGIVASDISFTRSVNDLTLHIAGTTDQITIQNYGSNLAARMASISFADGTVWDADYVNTQAFAVPIFGTEDADQLSAWIGEAAATMVGGEGSDTYTVLHIGDVVQEDPGAWYSEDTVVSSVDYTLGANIEDLVLANGASNGAGNALDNIIRGNAAANRLSGDAGDDTLIGNAGNDILDGGTGNDTLNGGTGRDTCSLRQGSGQDVIKLEDDLDDIVFGAGIKAASLVLSRTENGLTLHYGNAGDSVVLDGGTLHGISLADGTQLTLAQVFAAQGGFAVTGGSGDDYLADIYPAAQTFHGGYGNDVMVGGSGNTVYQVNSGDGYDSIYDLGGQDTLSFGEDVGLEDVWFEDDFSGNSPSFKVHYGYDDNDVVSIVNGDQGSIENFRFADGSVFSFGQMVAMQGFVASPEPTTGRQISLNWSSHDHVAMAVGTAGNDQISTDNGVAGLYIGGKGNDNIDIRDNDGTSLATVALGLGDGTDTLDVSTPVGILFGAGIDPTSLRFSETQSRVYHSSPFGGSGYTLYTNTVVQYGNQGDSLVIGLSAAGQYVNRFEFANGQHFTLAQMRAIAAFAGGGAAGAEAGDPSVYTFKLGDGVVNIRGSSAVVGGHPSSAGSAVTKIQFGLGIDASMLALDKGSLLIHVGNNGDALHLLDIDPNNVFAPHAIQSFVFADGTSLNYEELIGLGFDLKGTEANDVLTGTNADDRINGLVGNDVLSGGAGNDVLGGGTGSDTYLFARGDGADRIEDYDTAPNMDKVVFAATVLPSEVQVLKNGDDLELHVEGTSDTLVLGNWYSGNAYKIEQVQFADGTVWDVAQLLLRAPVLPMVGTENSDVLRVQGGAGTRVLGLGGSDTLVGGYGDDTLEGGSGDDTYLFARGSGHDTVIDSEGAGNRVLMGGDLTAANITLSRNGTDAVIGIRDTDDTLVLKNWFHRNTGQASAGAVVAIGFESGDPDLAAAYLQEQLGNRAPVVATPIASQAGRETKAFTFSVPAGTFTDADSGDLLIYTASLLDARGNLQTLPAWLRFNAATQVFSGTPGKADGGSLKLVVKATDKAGASAFSRFTLNVSDEFARTGTNAKVITGNASANVLNGTDLNEIIYGQAGADTLFGGAGNDTLRGGAGADKMFGGAGNDTYVVDNVADVVTESVDAGLDTVQASVTYALGANLENLRLTGAAAINATGNALSNVLTGNAGNNILNGGAGADILVGGAGSDTYKMGRGYGLDTVQENDATKGNADVLEFSGNVVRNQLWLGHVSNNLEISIIGTSDKLVVKDWYLGSQYHVEQIKTSDGKVLLDSQVQNLVNAMAAFSPPAAGQTTLPAPYLASLNPVLAANWQ
jgi:Ca2+-binding RTX toxin-like protein